MEWATLLYEVDVRSLNLPPWGGVIEWGGMDVLVYIPSTGNEIFLTNVTGETELIEQIGRTYNPLEQYWWYHLPEATTEVLWERAEDVGAVTNAVIDAATRPSTWSAIVTIGVIALVFISMRKLT